MKKSIFKQFMWFSLAVFFLSIPSAAEVQSPLEMVRESNQRILEIYSTYDEVDDDTDNKITEIMDSVTNFDLISKRTIEKFCDEVSEQECATLDRVFEKLLRISSIRKLGRYRADRFDYLGEEVKGDKALVKTIAYYQDDQVELDYFLELVDGAWMIVNYVADDVDTVRNYRKQFSRILRKESFSQLIERLQRKIDEYER